MRTKHLFYFCSIVCLALNVSNVSAQYVVEEQVTVAELVPGKSHYYAESNLDNWYLSIGAGGQTLLNEHNMKDAHFTLAMNMAVGKWITPYIGMRMSAMAGSLHFDWRETMRNTINKGSMKYGAFYVDFLWNMTNSLWGYNEKRFMSIIPFIGLGGAYGWHHTGTNDDTWAMPVTGGIKFNFRLAHYADFFIEGRVQAVADQFNHVIAGSQIETAISAIAGFSFKFRESRFKAYNPYVDQLAIAELNRRTNQLRAELDACMSRKPVSEPCPPCPEVTETIIVEQADCSGVMTASVSFALDSDVVTSTQMQGIYNVAQWLKDNPSCTVTITGYADRNTGSSEYNKELSKRRAEAVAHILRNTYGIDASRIVIEALGSDTQPYPNHNDWNRVVIFTRGSR